MPYALSLRLIYQSSPSNTFLLQTLWSKVHVSYIQNTAGSLIDSYDWCVYYTLHSNKECKKSNKNVANPLEYEPVNVQDKPEAATFGDSKVFEGISFAPCEAHGRHHIDRL